MNDVLEALEQLAEAATFLRAARYGDLQEGYETFCRRYAGQPELLALVSRYATMLGLEKPA